MLYDMLGVFWGNGGEHGVFLGDSPIAEGGKSGFSDCSLTFRRNSHEMSYPAVVISWVRY